MIKFLKKLFIKKEVIEKKYNNWVDRYGNKWNCKIYTKEQAEKASKSLVNCTFCQNCEFCINCGNCIECKYCVSCEYCNDCIKCTKCDYCYFLTKGKNLREMSNRKIKSLTN